MPKRPGLGPRGALFLVALVAVAGAWIAVQRRGGAAPAAPPPAGLLDAVPSGGMVIATVDVRALRASPVGSQLLGRGRSIAGIGEIGTLCGRDPLDMMDEVAIAVPHEGLDAGFGIVAAGRIDKEALLGCAAKVVDKRGGRAVRVPQGAFEIVRDVGGALSSAELMARDGGPAVLAEPAYLAASRASLEGKAPSAREDSGHARLRGLVGDGALVATVVLSESQRRSLQDELRLQQMAASPFGKVTGAALSIGVTARVVLHGVLHCADAPACAEVAKVVELARKEQLDAPATRILGLREPLAAVRVTAEGAAVHLRADLALETVLSLMQRIATLSRLASSGGAPRRPAPPGVRRSPPLPRATASAGPRDREVVPARPAAPPSARPSGAPPTPTPAPPTASAREQAPPPPR